MSTNPLTGRRIVVTRARKQAGTLALSLRQLGAEVVELPVIEIVPPDSYAPLDNALANLEAYQWLIVTSANTARVISERLALLGLSKRSIPSLKTVAIGSSTADAVRSCGLSVDLVPDKYVAESVVASFAEVAPGTRILLARAHIARDVIPEALRRSGALVDIVDAYQTVIPAESASLVNTLFAQAEYRVDAITFTSSSTVINFFTLLEECHIAALPHHVKALSIGPVTSATLRGYDWEPFVEAKLFHVAGLVEATVRAFQGQGAQ